MNEYFFGYGRGKIPEKLASKIDKIVRSCNVTFVSTYITGDGYKFWFSTPNLGYPFDKEIELEIWKKLETANLAKNNQLIGVMI